MVFESSKKSLIYNEFNGDERENWFSLKQKKFINTIDSFYYSVLLNADFTSDSKDSRVRIWRNFWKDVDTKLSLYDDYSLSIPGLPKYYSVSRFYYGRGTYEYRLSRPDYWDIFISLRVANSATTPILVQLRSKALWIDSAANTVRDSLNDINALCSYFGFSIILAQENRVDYCWHTNYIQHPETFFNPEHFAKIRLSRLSESSMHVKYNGNQDYEVDYLTLGKKSSKNVFFRVYLKSKEVVEMGYKAFFLKLWLIHGMISRYDFYCLEYGYENHSWKHVQYGRIKFYAEYGSDHSLREQCNDILNGKVKFNYDDLKYFCDMITPPVTYVLNIEFQTMRKFTSSLVFGNDTFFNCDPGLWDKLGNGVFGNGGYSFDTRLWDILNNYSGICDFLTSKTLRLVTPAGDINKSRREDCAFWQCLRNTKSLDNDACIADSKLIRTYDHEKNLDVIKKHALSSIAGINLHRKGSGNADSAETDIVDFITSLNDNDFADYRRFKNKRLKREDYGDGVGYSAADKFAVVSKSTGETYNM